MYHRDSQFYQERSAVDRATAFGRVLRQQRLLSRLSQERLAHEAGLTPNYISLLERGLRAPTIDTLWVIAKVLGLRPSLLVTFVEQELEQTINGS